MNDMQAAAQRTAIDSVLLERRAQDAQWGPIDETKVRRDPAHWLAILMEEVGEAAQAGLQGPMRQDLIEEVTQLTAVGLAWLEALSMGGPLKIPVDQGG